MRVTIGVQFPSRGPRPGFDQPTLRTDLEPRHGAIIAAGAAQRAGLGARGTRAGQDAQFTQKYGARVPLGRLAAAEDLKGPLVFLASRASSYVTGHELRVDGGFTAW